MNVRAESRSRREHPAHSASLLHRILGALLVFCIVLCDLLWKSPPLLAFHGAGSSQGAGHLTPSCQSSASRLFPIKCSFFQPSSYFSPWLNHLKIVCSHPSSSCFVCMSRKGNLGFCCNAIHKSLLESITLISSYCTPKKTEKNKNKGEPSMWLLCLAASRLLRKSAWLLRALIRRIFVHVPEVIWVFSS